VPKRLRASLGGGSPGLMMAAKTILTNGDQNDDNQDQNHQGHLDRT
jgi:hypothetical protein